MDVFSLSFAHHENACHIDSLSLFALEEDSASFKYDSNYTKKADADGVSMTRDRFERQQGEILNMISDHERMKGIMYDYIFLTRPDILYTHPFNITAIEERFAMNYRVGNRTLLFSPECCKFAGMCDRLAAAPYSEFSQMVRSSKSYFDTVGVSQDHVPAFENAFKHRAIFNNLSSFDIPQSFLTLRLRHVRELCAGNMTSSSHWTEALCHYNKHHTWDVRSGTDLNYTTAACQLLEKSMCSIAR